MNWCWKDSRLPRCCQAAGLAFGWNRIIFCLVFWMAGLGFAAAASSENSLPLPVIGRIVFVGDSIMVGVGVADPERERYSSVADEADHLLIPGRRAMIPAVRVAMTTRASQKQAGLIPSVARLISRLNIGMGRKCQLKKGADREFSVGKEITGSTGLDPEKAGFSCFPVPIKCQKKPHFSVFTCLSETSGKAGGLR